MSEWKPIATALRTQEPRLFYSPGAPGAERKRLRKPRMAVDWYREPWLDRAWAEYPEAPYTHWRELPAPPGEDT